MDPQTIEQYCDEWISSRDDGADPGEFGLVNFNNWLDAIGEPKFEGDEDEFLALVREVGFDPEKLDWA